MLSPARWCSCSWDIHLKHKEARKEKAFRFHCTRSRSRMKESFQYGDPVIQSAARGILDIDREKRRLESLLSNSFILYIYMWTVAMHAGAASHREYQKSYRRGITWTFGGRDILLELFPSLFIGGFDRQLFRVDISRLVATYNGYWGAGLTDCERCINLERWECVCACVRARYPIAQPPSYGNWVAISY